MNTDDDRQQDELHKAIKKAHDIARVIQDDKHQKEIWSFWQTKVCPTCSYQLFSLMIWSDRTQYECDGCGWKFTQPAVVCEPVAPVLK
jgi:hypothetical protein